MDHGFPGLQPFDAYDDRSLIENCCIKEAKQPWDLKHLPQKNERAVRVHVMLTLLMFALATAYRLQYKGETLKGEPVGWQRWRRQLLEQTRDQVIGHAQGYYGIFHIAEFVYCSPERNRVHSPRHTTPAHMARLLLARLGRWFPNRHLIFVDDIGYGTSETARFCRQRRRHLTLVSQFDGDAA